MVVKYKPFAIISNNKKGVIIWQFDTRKDISFSKLKKANEWKI